MKILKISYCCPCPCRLRRWLYHYRQLPPLNLGGIGERLDAREELLDLVLDMVDIYITHDDDCLIVWAIPLAVVSTQGFRLAAVDDDSSIR